MKLTKQIVKVENAVKPGHVLGKWAMVVLTLVSFVLGTVTGRAAGTAITINDYNFSTAFSSANWVFSAGSGSQTGGANDGEYAPTTSSYNPVPSYATTAGFLGWGPHYTPTATSETLSQELSATVLASTTYQFTGYYGSSLNNGYGSSYSSDAYPFVELLAVPSSGPNIVLASANLTNPPASGTFASWSLNFDPTNSAFVGDTLEIVLGFNVNGNQSSGGAAQVDWADIGLTSSPAPVVTSSQNPSLFSGAVIFTATLAGSPTPTGTVTFKDGTNTLGTGTLNGSGAAYYGTGALAIGTHSVTAVYSGDGNYSAGTSIAFLQTNTGPTSITISNGNFESPVLPASPGYTTVTPTNWTGSTGSVGEYIPVIPTQYNAMPAADGAQLGYISGVSSFYQTLSSNLLANQTYVLTLVVAQRLDQSLGQPYAQLIAGSTVQSPTIVITNYPAQGVFTNWVLTYTAPASGGQVGQALKVLLGDASASSQPNFDNVALYTGLGSTTALTSSQNPSITGGTVPFTATVTGPGGTPTGMVVFMDGTNTLGTNALNGSGVASFSTTNLPIGVQSITAVYGGDANFCGSAYSLTQTVTPTSLIISNYSFEFPSSSTELTGYMTGWAVNPNSGGSSYPNAGVAGHSGPLGSAPPDASQYGWIDSSSSTALTVAQQLTTTLAPNTKYTLGIYFSRQSSYDPGTNYSISLYAGGTMTGGSLGNDGTLLGGYLSGGTLLTNVTSQELTALSWTHLFATYTSGSSVTAGQNLAIVITMNAQPASPTAQLAFDDVTLTVTNVPGIGPANAYKITANTTTPAAGANDTITITQVDSSGNTESSFNGATNLTFSGLSAGPDSSLATVNGTNLGTATSISFTNGVSTATLLAHKAETATLNATDGTHSTTSTGGAGVSLTVSAGTANKLVMKTEPSSSVTAGGAFGTQPAVYVEDTYGNVVTTDGSTVTATVGTGTGTGPLTGTLTAMASSGVATFSGLDAPTLAQSGLKLTFTDGSLSSAVDATSITVNPASANKLVMKTEPSSSGTAGGAFGTQPAVYVEDTYGNVVTSDGSTVTATVGTGTGPLTGTLTATASSGVATFSGLDAPTLAQSGLKLTFTDGSLASAVDGTSITVSPSTANKLVMKTEPSSSVSAGGTFSTQPAVYVEDTYGNVVTTDGSTVTATVGTGTGPLTGTLTATASSGVATFSGLAAPTLAQSSLKLTFTDSGLASAVDATSITVTASTANKLVMKTEPSSSVTAGGAFSTEPAVYIEDQYNNVLTGDNSSSVTVAVQSGHGTGPLGGTLTVTASSGVATFSALAAPTLAQSGLELQFTDTGDSLSALNDGTSITVNPGTANKLVMKTEPSSSVTAGGTFSTEPAVNIEDQYNNVLTGDNSSSVTVAVQSGHGTGPLTGTLTATAVSGVATFSALAAPTLAQSGLELQFSDSGDSLSALNDSTSITVNPGTANKLVMKTELSSSVTAGGTFSTQPAVYVEDTYGNVVTSDGSTVTATVGTGTGPLTGTLTAVASSGVATFSGLAAPTLAQSGMVLTFTDTGDGLSALIDTTSITVNAAAASKLAYTTVPGTGTAGTAFSVTVQSQDTYGNPSSPTSTTTITLSKASGGGSLSGTLTGNILTSGNSVTISTPVYSKSDTMTLTATATAGETTLTAVTSGNIVFSPGAATVLVFTTQPGGATAGSAFSMQPVVVSRDANGNNSTVGLGTSKTVTIAIKTGTGTLQGTTTYDIGTSYGNGTITGNSLEIDEATSFTLKATASGLTEGDSSSFTVSPAAATLLVFTTQPDDATAGSAFGTQPVVETEDAYFNNSTVGLGSSVPVTIAIKTGTGILQGTTNYDIGTGSGHGNGTITGIGLRIDQATNFTLSATASGLTEDDSDSFTVSPAAASQLVFTTVPGTGTAGTPFSVTVQSQDAYTNPSDPTNATTITLSQASGGGALSGILTGNIATNDNDITISTPVYSKADTMTLTATATAGETNLSATTSGPITFSAGAVSAAQSTVAAAPASVTADGATTSTITVTLYDANNNPVSGKTVTLGQASGPGSPNIATTQGTTSISGVATFTVKSTTAGADVFAATDTSDSNLPITQTATVTFTAGAASAAQSTVLASPTSVTADGSTTSTITVTLEDAYNNPAIGRTVTLARTSGSGAPTITTTQGITDASGKATFTVKSTTAAADVFTATDTSDSVTITQTATVTFTVGTVSAAYSTISPATVSITANGSSTTTLTVQARDANNNNITVGGATVVFSKSSGTGTVGGTTDNGNGTYTATVTSTTATGSGTFTATLGGVAMGTAVSASSSVVTYTAGAVSAIHSTVSPATVSITADGSSTTTVTVQARDANNNNLTSGGATVVISKSSGLGAIGGTIDNGNGTYTATVTAPTATGSGTFAATLNGTAVGTAVSASTSVVTYTPGPVNAAYSTISPATATLTANGLSTQLITIQARDANSNNLTSGGASGLVSLYSGTGTIGSTADNGNGTYTATVTAPTTAGSGMFVGTLGGVAVGTALNATNSIITYAAGSLDHFAISAISSPQTAGTAINGITITAQDVNNNTVTNYVSTVMFGGTAGVTGTSAAFTLGVLSGVSVTPTVAGSSLTLTVTDGASHTGSATITTINPGTATKLVFTTQPAGATVGSAFSTQPVVKTQDTYGNNSTVGLASTLTVTIAIKTGTGTLMGTPTYNIGTSGGNGSITGSGLQINQAGSFTLSATVASGLTEGDSGSFAVGAAAANAYRSSVANTTPTAGVGDVVTIALVDQYGNTETGYSGTETVTFHGLNASPGGNTPTITSDNGSPVGMGTQETIDLTNGVCTATLVAYDAQSGSVTVTDGSHSTTSTGGSAASLTVSAAAANKLVMKTEPSGSVTVGATFPAQPAVYVEDAYGNVVTSDGSTVTATVGTGTGPLTGTLTATASSGVATFSGLAAPTLAQSGLKLAFTDTGDSLSALNDTTSITVNAAAANKLAITSTAVTTTVGVASSSITVQVQDQYGNAATTNVMRTVTLASTSTGTVTFSPTSLSIGSGSSSATFTYTDTHAGTPTITAASTSPSTLTSATQQETINKVTPTVTVTVGSYTYTGSSQGPNSYTTSPTGDTGTATWSYVGVSGTTYGPSATPPTLAGSYTAQVSLGSDSNNNAASSSATAFTIGKATPTVTVTVGSYTYTGSSQGPNSFTTSPTGDTGTATWSYVGVSGTTYGPSATPPTLAGSYTAQVSLGTDNNDNAASSSATAFTIGKATPTVTVTVGSYTYTGSSQGPNSFTTSPTGDTGTAIWSYVGVSGTSYGPSVTPPTLAGSYTAQVSLGTDNNDNAASSSATAFTISKAGSSVTLNGTTSFTYNGSPQGPAFTVSGSSGALAYSYSGTGGTTYSGATAPTAAGAYTVTATVAADSNYNGASSSATAFTIASATPAFSALGSVTNSYGVASIALAGQLGGTGLAYPASGDTVSATINGVAVNGTVTNATGGFWINYNDPSLATLGTNVYPITYQYNGNASVSLAAATPDASTSLTITQAASTNTLLTSLSPALPGSNVVFTATLTGVTTPTGTVQFNTNGAAFGPAVTLVSGVGAITNGTLPHGSNTITAVYSGDVNFLQSTGSLSQVIDRPPVPGTHSFGTTPSTAVTLMATNLAALDYDPDGDPLTVTNVSTTSTNGPANNVTFANGVITYTPATSYVGQDTFTYIVADPYGETATNTVKVTMRLNTTTVSSVISDLVPQAGAVKVVAFGIPGRTYWIEVTTNFVNGPWTSIGTNLAPASGVILFTNGNPPYPSGFYRLALPH